MIDQTTDALPEVDAEVIRLTPAQQASLAPYVQAVQQAQIALSQAFGLLLVGRGVDLDACEARLSADGTTAMLRRRD